MLLICREDLRLIRRPAELDTNFSLGKSPVSAGSGSQEKSNGTRVSCSKGAAIRRAVETLKEGLQASCSAAPSISFSYTASEKWSEVDELLMFLGLGHYAGALRREDVTSLSVLAQLSDAELESLGVRSSAPKLLIRTAARGLQVLIDRSHDERSR